MMFPFDFNKQSYEIIANYENSAELLPLTCSAFRPPTGKQKGTDSFLLVPIVT